MYQLGVMLVIMALAIFLALAGLIIGRQGGVQKMIALALAVLSTLINAALAYVCYKFNLVVSGFGGFVYMLAVYAAVIGSIMLAVSLIISTLVVLFPKAKGGLV